MVSLVTHGTKGAEQPFGWAASLPMSAWLAYSPSAVPSTNKYCTCGFWQNGSDTSLKPLVMSTELRFCPKGSSVKCTGGGIYALRRLQIKRSGRLGQRAVLALDCCPSISQMSRWPVFTLPEMSTNKFHFSAQMSQVIEKLHTYPRIPTILWTGCSINKSRIFCIQNWKQAVFCHKICESGILDQKIRLFLDPDF